MERAATILSKLHIKELVTIKRYESCVGLSFINIGRFKVEFWFAPAGYQIRPHTHNHEHIRLYFLFGDRVSFHRKRYGSNNWETFHARWFNIFRGFNIRAGDAHWFSVSKVPLIFVNIEEWLTDEPTSAADDLQLTNES